VEGGRLGRPCGPGALRAQSEKTSCGFAAIPIFVETWHRGLSTALCRRSRVDGLAGYLQNEVVA
jgi:hypothetical protein